MHRAVLQAQPVDFAAAFLANDFIALVNNIENFFLHKLQVPALESQRDSATKPRVARDELPWVKVAGVSQPQRGCGLVALPMPWAATLSGLLSIETHDPRVARCS